MSTEIDVYLQYNTKSFKLKMGQGQNTETNPVLDSNWVTLTPDTPTLFSNVNPFAKRTLRNTTNNEEVEEYLVEFASQFDFKEYTQKIKMRMQPSNSTVSEERTNDGYYHFSPYIYTVKYFMNNNLEDMCATIYKGLLYAQKVDLRLKQINDIPLSDQLYLIKATLQGFKLLYQNEGYFDITEEMVFINKDGRVKVWINSNLSKNQPLFIPNNPSKDVHGSQSEMIVQLLDLIEENSDTQQIQGIRFKEYLSKKGIYNRLSFYRALDQFEAYCLQYHLVVEKAMRSIHELYHQDQMERSEVVEQTDNRANNQKIFAQLKVPNEVESKQMISSRISKGSQPESKSILNRSKIQNFNRPQSINTKQPKKMQEITFNNAKLPPQYNYDNQKAKELPHYLNHFLTTVNIPPAMREMSPVIKIRAPSHTVSRKSSYNQKAQSTKPPVIKFNYMASQGPPKKITSQHIVNSKQSPLPVITQNIMTIQSIRTDSRASTKQMNPSTSEGLRQRNCKKWINYYTSDQIYTLDKQIAQDLQKYLGYDVNS